MAAAGLSIAGGRAIGANERIVCGVMGCGGRSRQLIGHLAKRDDTAIATLADCDSRRLGPAAERVEKLFGEKPKTTTDFRNILDDKSVDVLFSPTPDHWHALSTILACQAGKDVYVEKPVSHNVWEGRQMIRAARKYDRVVQIGTQNRSAPYVQAAVEAVRSGKLGPVRVIRVVNMKNRHEVPPQPNAKPPEGVNYDMWLGPAPKRAFNPNNFHYRWHWFWDFSGGDIINDGVHQMDVARWISGRKLPTTVVTTGGKYHFKDAQETPDTQHVLYDYGDLTLSFELALYTPYMKKTPMKLRDQDLFPRWPFSATRVEVYGTDAMMMFGRHGAGWQIFTVPKRNPYDNWEVVTEQHGRRPGDAHIANFLDCVRSRKRPNADVEPIHLSTVLCHLGNISYRVGGAKLTFDAEAERFVDNDAANELLKRVGRSPWQIPEEV
jgi:predicted dehydrogenase